MPLRHTIYCHRSVEAVTPEIMLKHLNILDFSTLAEDYQIPEDVVRVALPLRIRNNNPKQFRLYHLFYGELEKRPIEIDRWDTEDQHRSAVEEAIDNLKIQDKASAKRISESLRKSVDSVSVSFGMDPAAAMFAWEVARYFASQFDGIVKADDVEWLTIAADYKSKLV